MPQESGSTNFPREVGWFLLVLSQVAQFNCQSPQGYWSVDCGLAKDRSYSDSTTGLKYTSDDQFVETGEVYDISRNYVNSLLPKQYLSIRSFPNGSRNCYTFEPIVPSNKYLLRLGFLYGNYDALNSVTVSTSISFDLYIGVNFWQTVNITNASQQYQYEIITVELNDFLYICLVNTGFGTPFISFIEIRQMKPTMYAFANSSQFLNLNERYYLAANTSQVYRYPDDPYDRIWRPWLEVGWTAWFYDPKVNTSSSDMFEVPSIILQHAATNTTAANGSMHFKREYPRIDERYLFLHFTEYWPYLPSGSRSFYIHANNFTLTPTGAYSPPYHMPGAVYTPQPYAVLSIEVLVEATLNSTHEPFLNAMEVYSVVRETEVTTLHEDFDAIKKIRERYTVKRNWVGDPCSPKNYSWDGVSCNYTIGTPPMIISLNLSSSGLTGPIADYFSDFGSIQILDLSNNRLRGDVPSFFANMSSLAFLNLTGNCLSPVTGELLQRSTEGTLALRYDNTTEGCGNINNPKKKSLVVKIVPASIASIIIAATLVWMIIRKRRRKKQTVMTAHPTERASESVVLGEISPAIRFTKSQLEKNIKTLNKHIGGGGFGEVFYGKLENDTEVAIKVLSRTSSQGYKEFKKEVEALSRVYHANIVKFIGYCEEEDHLALVYEYMPNKSVADQLHDRFTFRNALSWDTKLKIAYGAAQGLEYLHTGHRMVHRDVKSANILLDQNFEAKVSDFGMSRTFDENTVTMTQSAIGGTFGYLDPEVLTGLTKKLSFSSDVYSFGVVLLEMLTGQPPYSPERGRVHLVEYVSQNPHVIDPKMGEYATESMRMVLNLAMQCTLRASKDRPTMSYIVLELQQCLDAETSHQWSTNKTISAQMSSYIDEKNSSFGDF